MAANFYLRHTQMTDSIPTSLFVLPDPENMGIAVRFSLLSCIRAEIYVISHVLPVNGRHNQTSDSIANSLSVLPDPENMGIAVGISLQS